MKTAFLSRNITRKLADSLSRAIRRREAAIRASIRRLLGRLTPGWWIILRDGPEAVTAIPASQRNGHGYPVARAADMGAAEMAALASLVAESI